jgi:ArsR family transcriptional regulator
MTISLNEMRAKLRNPDAVILDVLTREVFAKGHIPGAINIPVAELRERASVELPDRRREIVAYCGGPT